MHRTGLEPASLSAVDPKSTVCSYFTTGAYIMKFCESCVAYALYVCSHSQHRIRSECQ